MTTDFETIEQKFLERGYSWIREYDEELQCWWYGMIDGDGHEIGESVAITKKVVQKARKEKRIAELLEMAKRCVLDMCVE